MTSTNTPTSFAARPAGMRRFAHAALLAGALAIGASAFGHTAIASADWDIEVFDNCMHNNGDEQTCCVLSDGTWGANGHCQAGRILQQIPRVSLGPRLGSAQPPVLPTRTLGTPVS
jgi:hypothetical protein